MSTGQLSEEDFICGICFELLVDPTTLTCGHSICRFCLAQWWYKSKKATCPECRQVWQGFPKVNVTLRNTMKTLFPDQIEQRRRVLLENNEYKSIISKFEEYGRKQDTPPLRSLSWTLICIMVAVTVAVAVIISVGIKSFTGLTKKDLMAKSLRDWSSSDVGLWIGTLGPWAKDVYDQRFIEAGIDGTLLLEMNEVDLEIPPINMSMRLQRRKVLDALKELRSSLSHHPSGFWEYKEQKSGMMMFIMCGLREFPRSTLAFLYLFNYWDTFMPIFYCTVTIDGNRTTSELLEMAHNPTLKNWLEFLPFYIFVPYYLVAKFASHFFEINYWTSRVVVVHALLMTIMEFTKAKFLFRSGLRQIPYLLGKHFTYVVLLSLFCKIVWPFIPFFIADCIFYWMLYVSPFDALNRLRKRFTALNRGNGADANVQNEFVHAHQHRQHDRGWHFNFEWNAN